MGGTQTVIQESGHDKSFRPWSVIVRYATISAINLAILLVGVAIGAGSIGVYLLLSHHIQTDELVANGIDLLKLHQAEINLLSRFVPASEITNAINEARVPEDQQYQVATQQPSRAQRLHHLKSEYVKMNICLLIFIAFQISQPQGIPSVTSPRTKSVVVKQSPNIPPVLPPSRQDTTPTLTPQSDVKSTAALS